jgi:polyisoprenoid-binding protein YceI
MLAVTKWKQCMFVLALMAWPRLSPCAPLQADTSASELVIRAGRTGLLSALGHDHQFVPARWRTAVEFDPQRPEELRVDVRVDASTLHDRVGRLAPKMQAYVDRETAGPEVLDAQHYREIRFHGESANAQADAGGFEGVLHGELSLHGTTQPLDVPFHALAEAQGYRVTGSVRFRQTAFGMKPFSTAGGSIGVDDEIQVDFALVLLPASGATVSLGLPGQP